MSGEVGLEMCVLSDGVCVRAFVHACVCARIRTCVCVCFDAAPIQTGEPN